MRVVPVILALVLGFANPVTTAFAESTGFYTLRLIEARKVPTAEFKFEIKQHGTLLVTAGWIKSLDELMGLVSIVPAGSVIKWDPGCLDISDGKGPLSTQGHHEEFRTYLKSRGVEFAVIPSG